MFCYALLVMSSFAIISMGKRGSVALLCLVVVMCLFLGMQCMVVVFPDQTHLLFNTCFCTCANIVPYSL